MGKSWKPLILLIIIASCNGQKKMAENQDASQEEKMTLVDQNNYSGADSTETMVITSAKALKSFYSRINRTRKPGLPVPEIDFSKNTVIILCSSDANYVSSEKLSVLDETDSEIILGMEQMDKGQISSSSSNSNEHVSPFFVYTMPLTEKKVSFKMMK